MLIVCKTIKKKELALTQRYFSEATLIEAYEKAKKHLGQNIPGSETKDTKLIKVYITSRNAPGRIIFLFFVKKDIYTPVILRTKTDKIGANMTIRNPLFEKLLETNLDSIFDDIRIGAYEKVSE